MLYIPCNDTTKEEFQYHYDQIQDPKLVIGDFNAHHPNWNTNNSKSNNIIWKNLVKLINQNNILLLTPKGQVSWIKKINKQIKNKEAILDLVLGSAAIDHLNITTGPHLANNHLPVIIKDDNYQISSMNLERKWNLTKEGWSKYILEVNKINIDIEMLTILLELIKNTWKKHFNFDHKKWTISLTNR